MTPRAETAEKTNALSDLGNVRKKLRFKNKYTNRDSLRRRGEEVILNWVTSSKRQKGDMELAVNKIIAHTKSIKDNGKLEPGSLIYAIFAYIRKWGTKTPHSPILSVNLYYRNYYYEIIESANSANANIHVLKRDDKVLIELPAI
ncbi:MAG TPA: hypothetical protein PK950_01890 [Candidatus Paceibacterota bacterium]|nr:hypothetical protein [Candidatus Paceibacterota bacterium]